ncbi:hypothetical protein DU191_00020 [Salmonella enterica subsp. enterica serovar Sandiego]|nr:hypothetical protein [Salmonella enterica subsp. enterica serovar Sandiego]
MKPNITTVNFQVILIMKFTFYVIVPDFRCRHCDHKPDECGSISLINIGWSEGVKALSFAKQ